MENHHPSTARIFPLYLVAVPSTSNPPIQEIEISSFISSFIHTPFKVSSQETPPIKGTPPQIYKLILSTEYDHKKAALADWATFLKGACIVQKLSVKLPNPPLSGKEYISTLMEQEITVSLNRVEQMNIDIDLQNLMSPPLASIVSSALHTVAIFNIPSQI